MLFWDIFATTITYHMHKKLLTALLLAAPFISFSQSLTANEFPLVGDTLSMVNGDTSAYAVPSFGSGQTWDYSAVSFAGTKTNILFVDPSKTTNGSKFSGSNIAEQTTAGAVKNTIYYTRNGSSLTIIGTDQSGGAFGVTMPYADNEKLMDYPFASGSSKTDTYGASAAGSFGTTNYRNGQVNTYYRGSGTLKTPNMTYNNAILIEIESQQIDSTKSAFGSFVTQDFVERRFLWGVSGTRGWVMETSRRDNKGLGGTVVTKTMRTKFVASAGVGIAMSNITNLSLYPNPTGYDAVLTFYSLTPTQLKIYDACGKECLSLAANGTGQQQVSLPVSGLKAGIYLVRVNGETLKFVKQ